jgi:hypothetical protein
MWQIGEGRVLVFKAGSLFTTFTAKSCGSNHLPWGAQVTESRAPQKPL